MVFNTAVSGLLAANADLGVVGNNIANASTTGFKSSRTEFADVYAASGGATGGGSDVGSGVRVKDVAQQFSQGSVSFTNNNLDLAINGNGFFVLSDGDSTEYSRSGIFGVDAQGTIVDSAGKALQGFGAGDTGVVAGGLGPLTIDTANIEPQRTTNVESLFNLDASEIEPAVRGSNATSAGLAVGQVRSGNTNGYPSELVTFALDDGTSRVVTTVANASAEETASQFNLVAGVSATAVSRAELQILTDNGGLDISLNGVTLNVSTGPGSVDAQAIAVAINTLTNTTLPGITAIHDAATNTVSVTSNTGADLMFGVASSGDPLDSVRVAGTSGNDFILRGDGLGNGNNDGVANDGLNVTIGGTLSLAMEEGVAVDSALNDGLATDNGSGLFEQDIIASPFVDNFFDPIDQDTYNHTTSVSVFDSLGNSHVLTMYFVKESSPNSWSLYTTIDGENIGEPNPALDPPFNTEPTLAGFRLQFNEDGSLDQEASDEPNISYWTPLNAEGNRNGALTGLTYANGATFPVSLDSQSSNFSIDISSVTQFGADFSVQDMVQDGYTVGRLADVDVADDGTIFTRFTNGQARVLGQVALANFANYQGLQPIGSTAWAETFESGTAVIGTPGSSALGQLQSGAVEESNVDLSEELVALIIAQRNFQANSKTIQTADAVTQSIINLR